MNKIIANKQSNIFHQKPNKSMKKLQSNKSSENKKGNQNRNKLRQFNKNDVIKNNTYNSINPNLRQKSNQKYIGNNEKNKTNNVNIHKINSNQIKNNLQKSNKILNSIPSLNPKQKKEKKVKIEINNENINTNIISNPNPILNNFNINPKTNSNQNINSFNSNNNIFKPDINNLNFLCEKKPKDIAKTDIKRISKQFNIKKEEIPVPNFENLKYISLEDTNALFNAWQNCSMIYKIFEEKFMKKNDFEINKNTLELITKNTDACKELNEQKFWILYIEYLINNNLLINEKQFISVINEAFSYMTYNCTQLRIYYLQKIKKYAPVYLSDGTFDDSDETYINKLNEHTINFINRQKGASSSNVKLKSAKKNCKLEDNKKTREINRENKIRALVDNGGKFK